MFTNDIHLEKIPTWYKGLKKPILNPPNWIFGPVWTSLYLMIGFSGYLIWKRNQGFNEEDNLAWIIYFLQLFLNFTWTPIFFGVNYLFLAFINIILLDITVLFNILLFSEKSILAGRLLIPYMLWISFATYLNFLIWYLNRDSKESKDK